MSIILFLNFQLTSLSVQHSSEWLKILCLRTEVHSIRAVDESWQLKGRKVSGGAGVQHVLIHSGAAELRCDSGEGEEVIVGVLGCPFRPVLLLTQ